jgi:predicted amidohydrolase YtcJ
VRGIGYHESVAGDLDRPRLDALAGERPVRVQHRSGMVWVLNSAAIARLGLDRGETPSGAERDPHGNLTGRFFRLDDWLRVRLGPEARPRLRDVGRQLAAFGVTGVTDATVTNDRAALDAFVAAVRSDDLPQRLLVMGGAALPEVDDPVVRRGALKIVLDEPTLPSLDELCATIAFAHGTGRAVAVHSVTRSTLFLATTALRETGSHPGDRIEHAAVAPPEAVVLLADLGVTVVTQPNFVRERGDAYLHDVAPDDRPWLYRCRSLLAAGIALGGGTDAPFGDTNPWLAMQAAVVRRTLAGRSLGGDEHLTPEQALALFTSPPEAPGAAPRRIDVGAPADLCLLDRPWAAVRHDLGSVRPRTAVVRGVVV